jgi:hypothetical protein
VFSRESLADRESGVSEAAMKGRWKEAIGSGGGGQEARGGLGSQGRFPPSLPVERSHCLLDRPVVSSRSGIGPGRRFRPRGSLQPGNFRAPLNPFPLFPIRLLYVYSGTYNTASTVFHAEPIFRGSGFGFRESGAQARRGVAYDVLDCPERLSEQGRRPLPCSTAGTSQGRIGAGQALP